MNVKNDKPKRKGFSMRIPEEMLERLTERANRNFRSVNRELLAILQEKLAEEEPKRREIK